MSDEFLDHTSELTVRLRAGSFPDLIAEAGRALSHLMLRGETRRSEEDWREIPLCGPDQAALLVEWINELIYRAEVEQWAPVDLDVAAPEPLEIRVRARGVALDEPFVLVKAATLHGLFVRHGPDGLEAEVTLDV
jgi:SHS2 domain-containing protein